ncbi:LysR family transcriptional regulator [Pokkaliibacter plantistimulans]|uniref:LysR family transcriptional regulator n=1 Tax=Proteobacteria bacterium 228 TaxID=2083153 RepID=A0A2S5KP56_9PROT|nr:LysR family transcriptional regulator [Pokkaliibacter plantistimulans]PPC76415.1 LysR family transcriptional regulator [Pokkaliibacter plantistimulans]
MLRENAADLVAFLTVAEEGNFTRAAVKLGVSQSALSQNIRTLEERLGVRLLSRTTRRVAPTEAGERLRQTLAPRFEAIENELSALTELRDKPAGNIRISATDYACQTLLLPKLQPLLQQYPEINVEIIIDYGLTDIVSEHFDAGVRSGEQVAKDMIAVCIGPDIRMAIVASPRYFSGKLLPKTPQDLTSHNCINLRLPTRGAVFPWELAKDGRELNVRTHGQLVLNNTLQKLNACLAGYGVASVPLDLAQPYIDRGELIQVLDDWCQPYSGHYLYYANRRQSSRAFDLVVEALRYRH